MVLVVPSVHAEKSDDTPTIRSVRVVQKDVFGTMDRDWFFGASWLNSLHVMTKPYVLDDEIFFDIGDDLDTIDLLETERVLRMTRIFSTGAYRERKFRITRNPAFWLFSGWNCVP